MANLIYLLFLLMSWNTSLGGEGEIVAHLAPLFKDPNINSEIVGEFKRGQVVYIHDKHFLLGRDQVNKKSPDRNYFLGMDVKFDSEQEVRGKNDFFITLDSLGNDAYIAKKHVRLIYKDSREHGFIYNDIEDDTDYRIPEPLKKNFPYVLKYRPRGFFTFVMHPNSIWPIPYAGNLSSIEEESPLGVRMAYGLSVGNLFERTLSAGFIGGFKSQKSLFSTQSGFEGNVSFLNFSVGPYLSLDIYSSRNWRFTQFLDIKYNYNKGTFRGEFESTGLGALYISGELGVSFERKNLLGDLDIIGGSFLSTHYPYSFKSEGAPADLDSTKLENSFFITYALFLGIQKAY